MKRIRSALTAPFRAFIAWQAEIPDEGRVAVVGLLVLGAGLALAWPPAGLIVPGVVLAAVGLGFNLRHPVVAVAAVVAISVVAIATLAVAR